MRTWAAAARVQAEGARQESEERFQAVANLVPYLLATHEPGRETTTFNQRWLDYTGQEQRESRGNSWAAVLHPDDRPGCVAALEAAIRTGTRVQQECRLRRHDGAYRWFLVRGEPVWNESREMRRWYGLAIDIDDLKRTEIEFAAAQERLRLIVDSAQEHAIIAMDPRRLITNWNLGAERATGYSREEVIGLPGDIIFTAEDRANRVPDLEAAKALTEGRAPDERWHRRRDDSRFWGSGVMLPMRANDDGLVGFVKIFRDETARRTAQEQADAAMRAKDDFLAVLSHELRTPLTPVLLGLGLVARRRDVPPEVQEMLAVMRKNVQLEVGMVDDLLDLTRIARGKMELETKSTDFHAVIRNALEISAPQRAELNQTVAIDLAAAHHEVAGHASRLQQAVWNLLRNAAKFSPAGSTIKVRTYNEDGRVALTVTDDGIGIAPDKMERIFVAFEQADRDITRRFGGLGLGLSIARAIIAAHGGEVRAASAGLGRGATFTVLLPLRENTD
jgi:two-component system CheB/CheR fusion protein